MMNKVDITYQIEFLSEWHCGSGLTSGSDLDALVIKDRNNLPYVPGKTIKGLVREAIEDTLMADSAIVNNVFGFFADRSSEEPVQGQGTIDKDVLAIQGCAFFTDAVIDMNLANFCIDNKLTDGLYRSQASTAINNKGVAKHNSLRVMEATIPCCLTGQILNVPEVFVECMTKGLKLIKRLGQNRNKGLGRCVFKEIKTSDVEEASFDPEHLQQKNSTLHFKCTLLTDIVLNQKAATEGNQQSLDFIPGNNFLGIAASLYKDKGISEEDKLLLFHSGKLRFGDAHPEINGMRSLRIPAAFSTPKLASDESKKHYIHHASNVKSEVYRDHQPRQCRNGFYLMFNNQLIEAKTNKSFAIKSAYDSNKRRSEDEKMYGYQSLAAGNSYLFDLDFDKDVSSALIEKVVKAIVGKKRVGRSRTAQYGLVKIEQLNPTASYSYFDYQPEHALVYADGRLIFLDDYGLPCFQPTADQLGFPNANINWKKSQIRTFQYAPWNFKRQVRDTDRCGIEKGSVFYIEGIKGEVKPESKYVGYYRNEGFGKVIVNPDFLQIGKEGELAEALYQMPKKEDRASSPPEYKAYTANRYTNYLAKQAIRKKLENEGLKKVNEFVATKGPRFHGEQFASQWGNIRSLILNKQASTIMETIENYIKKGVAQEQWEDKNREHTLLDFISGLDSFDWLPDLSEDLQEWFNANKTEMLAIAIQNTMVNLATEMSKQKEGMKNE